MSPSPAEAARHEELVAEVMEALEGTEDLPAPEQLIRLSQAQQLLAAVLDDDPAATQLGIPGVS